MPPSQRSNSLFLSTAPQHYLENTPPGSPKSAFLNQLFESPGFGRSRSHYSSSGESRDPLIDMYQEKRRNKTLTQLEEQLVQEIMDLRKKLLKILPDNQKQPCEPCEDAFELSASVKSILRSVRVGSRVSSAEYHLIRCMKTLKHTQKELYETKQLVEKQNVMLENLLVQNNELIAYITQMKQERRIS